MIVLYCQINNFFLYPVQKSGSMRPVHLGVVKLERNSQCCFQQTTFVLAPDEERIIEYAAVHTHCAVYFILRQCRSSDNHAVRQVMVGAAFSYVLGELQVVVIEQR